VIFAWRLMSAAALLLGAGAPAVAKPVAKAPLVANWTRSYSVTPDGGFRIGDPNAKVAVVEYGSLVCPHCRHFAETAMKPLMDQYVRPGKVSYEFRPLILSGIDIAANLVARCGGPPAFFPIADKLYATQPVWLGRVTEEQNQRIANLPESQMYAAFAKATGIVPIVAGQGLSPAKADKCLRDRPAALRLAEMAKVAQDLGITGTPTFFVNGKRAPIYDWESLKPFLAPAGT
jgi:protein-disulfide isomerase